MSIGRAQRAHRQNDCGLLKLGHPIAPLVPADNSSVFLFVKSKPLKNKAASKAKSKRPPSRAEWLAMRPLRNPQLGWHEDDSHVVLTIQRATNWKTKLLGLLVPIPDEKTVVLDKIGTDVWKMLDGETTVGQIAKTLARSYQIEPREAELSLQQFFKELGRRGYVGFWVEDKAQTS